MNESLIQISFDEQNYVVGTLAVHNDNNGGLVIFVHGSGSSGYSPRNEFLSKVLNESGLATLLIDLLSPSESKVDNITKEYRFNIELLTKRLVVITDWMAQNHLTKDYEFGYFGSSTGAAVSNEAAIQRDSKIRTIVTRSGRPDLVEKKTLQQLISSILLIVGSNDPLVIDVSNMAMI